MVRIYFELIALFLQCVVANIDADDKKNAKVRAKYEIAAFPTILFFPKENKEDPDDYEGGRTEEDIVEFLNKKCGTQRAVGGGLNDEVCFTTLFACYSLPSWLLPHTFPDVFLSGRTSS